MSDDLQEQKEAQEAILNMLKQEDNDSNLVKDMMAGVTIPIIQYYEEKINFLKVENLGLRQNIKELQEELEKPSKKV